MRAWAILLFGVVMKRGGAFRHGLGCGAKLDRGAKKTKHEQVVAGQFLLMAGVKVAWRMCADALADDDRKLEWTLDALEFEDPFDKEVVVHSDILKCLRCPCFLSFWCAW